MPADRASVQIDDDDLPDEPQAADRQPAEPKKPAKPQQPAREPQAAAEPPAQKKPAHSTVLLKAAAEFGFTPDDLEGFSADEIWEELHRLRTLEAAKPQQQQKPAEPTAPAKPPADPDEEYLAELEKVDPQLTRLLRKAIAGQDLKPIHEKLSKLDALEAAEQTRQARALDRAIDAAFAALPEKFLPLVGEGPIAELTDPGQKGWRGEIYRVAGIKPGDTARQIAAKVAKAAEERAGQFVKEPAAQSAYDRTPPAPKPPAADRPRDANGRYTVGDFNGGLVHRPNGKQTGIEQLEPEEKARRAFREAGDPRGFRPVLGIEDDDLPD